MDALGAPVHLATHVEHLRAAGQSPRTIEARIAVITRLSASLGSDPSHATTQQLARWLARPGWSRSTRAIYRYHLAAYCRWVRVTGLAETDPAAALGRIRAPVGPPRPVPTQVLAQIMARARPPYLVYFALAAYAGLRCQEIATLEREDVTVEQIEVRSGKGGRGRLVPTHEVIWRLVEPMPAGPLFHLVGYAPHVAAHKLSMYGARVLAKLGASGVTMHQLRHWFGSETFRRSKNLRATQELLGHASVATTQRYTQVTDEERRQAVQALPAVA